MAENKKNNFYEQVAETIIEQLKDGTAPWLKPWKPGQSCLPHNPVSGTRYKGGNAMWLAAVANGKGYEDTRWMTYKQAKSVNAQVSKGEKGTRVQYWKFSDRVPKRDENGKPVLGDDGKPVMKTIELERPKVFSAVVFNGEQIEGLPPQEKRQLDWNPQEKAETILANSGATILHNQNDRAYYSPATDKIHLPGRDQFDSADNYYATALHELGHWTGHSSRLDRDILNPFGSEGYAKEELRAEIASMMLGDELGIGHDPGQHVAYVGSWIKALQNDPAEVFRASRDAEKIMTYVLDLEHSKEQALDQEQAVESREPQLYQLADNQETYGERAGWWMVVTHDNETELSASFPTEEEAEQERQKIMSVAKSLVDFREGGITEDDFNKITNQELGGELYYPFTWSGVTEIRPIKEFVEHNSKTGEPIHFVDEVSKSEADFFGLYTQDDDSPTMHFSDHPTEEEAEARASTLKGVYLQAEVYQEQALSVGVKQSSNHEMDQGRPKMIAQENTYLAVPFQEKDQAKKLGARWDKGAKSWFAPKGTDLNDLSKWLPDSKPVQEKNAQDPRLEFKDALIEAGFHFKATELPKMDGKMHRVRVDGDERNETSGAYVGYLDGHPAGMIQNWKTGAKFNWKSTGAALSEEEKAKLQAEAAQKRQERENERLELHTATSKRCIQTWSTLKQPDSNHPYLENKQVGAYGLKQNDRGELVLPARDTTGQIWSLQRISDDGSKGFEKDSRKAGCFHVVGDESKVRNDNVVMIAEGYATAATLHEATGKPVLAAFDSGNLKAVALEIQERAPDKKIVFMGDDDRHRLKEGKPNVGREKAEEAAKLVNGKAIFPAFNSDEYRHKMTDFNDLHKSRGLETVKRQVESVLQQVKREADEQAVKVTRETVQVKDTKERKTQEFKKTVGMSR